MSKTLLRSLFIPALALLLVGGGCAGVPQRVDLLYQPAAKATGGSGSIYLALAPEQGPAPTIPGQWVIGESVTKNGEKNGFIVTHISPGTMVLDAFSQELRRAGYQPLPVKELPAGVEKGLLITGSVIRLDATTSTLMAEVTSRVKVSVEPWRNGKAVSRLHFESVLTDSAASDRDRLPVDMLQKGLQTVMASAVPDVVTALEKKEGAH